MSKWKTYLLTDAVDKLIDYRGKTPIKTSKGIPLITAKVIKNGHISTPNEFIAEDDYDGWMTRGIPEYGDVVLTTEAPLGEVAQIETYEKIALAQRVITLRGKKGVIDSTYLKYFLFSPIGQGNLKAKETGSTVTGIKQSELRKLEIYAPDFNGQVKIASILSSLDKKIQLNIQMNQTLEEMAQHLFKEWFVNFNFPGFDDELANDLPIGWHKGKLGEVLELVYGKALKAETRTHGQYPVIGSNGIVGCHNEYLVKAPGIVIGRKGTIGEVLWIDENFFPIDTTFYVKDLLNVKGLFYHYFLLKEQSFKKIGSDSAVPGLNRTQAMDSVVTIPHSKIIKMFNSIVKPIFEKKQAILNESKTLTELRDNLLPKLMTGKIEINA
ncbi:type I restriction enzyme, S subunit [Mucilaginibacter lappiensis]|uniref:Type I restriction enzyme S subunit n=1 Tax=Mucilaginibacter lappiensis TaxID=354630 RepID=A0ABR6PNC4_9SPHI|nr:restriction endonuclease subunit S [Mucilaginibacter lappiensis]MBB6111272.1 type I restriction enzyme S subunit [Mucilaginibacter lappiensis]SIR74351.1 type I restriction enzyme, S subunit [Mucilaginibacter lappiensis]